MPGKGETVKYIIDADTSGFSRGMARAVTEAELAGKKIDKALTRTANRSENNFKDIRVNASTAANQIRNFAVAFSAFNITSVIVGVTALSGAILELSGALAAAGSTATVLIPIFAQITAGSLAVKAGVAGLGDAFKAIAKNDGEDFQESLEKLGPAATEVAYAVGGLNNALNSIKLNTQQALLKGVGDTLLELGGNTLPIVNRGFQVMGQALNRTFNEAANLANTPIFRGVLNEIFNNTARSIDTLSEALGPLLTIFTNLYLITAPYVQLFAEYLVGLSEASAAYLSSAKGQRAFNLSIAFGVIALQQLGGLIGSVFGLLTSIFRTAILSGNSLISTLTEIINATTEWVNSAEGQAKLVSLFRFTAITLRTVAGAIGNIVNVFLGLIQAFSTLNPALQQMVLSFLVTALVVKPILTYFTQLYLAFRVLAVTAFNVVQQMVVVFGALGAIASAAVIVAGALIVIGSIIKGPLGSALIIIGAALITYITLSYFLTLATNAAAASILRKGQAAIATAGAEQVLAFTTNMAAVTMLNMAQAATAAGGGLSFAARAALFLQAALIPLLVLATGILIVLGMLGVFSSKAKDATSASVGLGGSLGSLQGSLNDVNSSGNKTSTGGLSALSDSLNDVSGSAEKAQKGLAGFDKMNVLTDKTSGGAGIAGLPALPAPDFGGGLGGGGLALPDIDTGNFDDALSSMTKQFEDLQGKFDTGLSNPFAAIGEFISSNPIPFFIAFSVILGVIIALFATGAVSIGLAVLPLTLIAIAIVAIVAILVILFQNWSKIWPAMRKIATDVVTGIKEFFTTAFTNIGNFVGETLTNIGNFFKDAWEGIKLVWGVVIDFFVDIFRAIGDSISFYVGIYVNLFKLAWEGVKLVWSVVGGFFSGVWSNIANVFGVAVRFFGDVFRNAWNAIKNVFNNVTGFFRGVWNSIVGVFGRIGVAVGNAIGKGVKGAINNVLNLVENTINTFVNAINGVVDVINAIPGVKLGKVSRVNIPRLARGGIIDSPIFAQLGEDGQEAVMPLENNTGWIDKLADKINSSNGNSDGQPINLTVQIGEDKVANKIIELINEKTQMSGRNTIRV